MVLNAHQKTATALLVMLLSFSCFAAPEELEYAYPDISVWTTKRDENGKLKNPLIKLAGDIFSEAKIPWHSQDYPPKRMFSNLRTGISKFSMLVNAESLLQGCCLVGKDPVARVEIRIFYREGSEPVDSIEQLNGKDVITIHGYGYAGYLKYINDPLHNIRNTSVSSHKSAFSMLALGRANYVIDYALPAAEVLDQAPIEGLRFSTLKTTDVFLVLHKNYPDAEKVLAKLEKIASGLDKSALLTSPDIAQQ